MMDYRNTFSIDIIFSFLKFDKLDCSIIIFELPYRVIKTLNDISLRFGDRVVSICREITKIYEENYFGYISKVLDELGTNKLKGEFVLIVAKEGYSID